MSEEISVESLAKEKGWREDFTGEGAKTAAEYIRHSTVIEKKKSIMIEGQNKKIDAMNAKTSEMAEMMSDMQNKFNVTSEMQSKKHAADIEAKVSELEDLRNTAIDQADRTEVKKIDKQIKDVEAQKEVVKTASEKSKEQVYFENWWNDKKQWLSQGSEAEKEMNKAIALFRIDRTGDASKLVNVEEELKAAEEHLKKKYPDNFGLKPEEKPPGGAVGEGNASSGTVVKELTVGKLEPEELREYNEYKRIMGKNFNPKAMLKNFSNMREARS